MCSLGGQYNKRNARPVHCPIYGRKEKLLHPLPLAYRVVLPPYTRLS
jgi:hypothetical protein